MARGGQKKKFPCGHRGFGRSCHACQDGHPVRRVQTDASQSRSTQSTTVMYNYSRTPYATRYP